MAPAGVIEIIGRQIDRSSNNRLNRPVWRCSPGLVRPESRGFVRLQSTKPRDQLEIHANLLSDPRDLAALREGMWIAREIGNSEAMRAFAKREILPAPVDGEPLDDLIRDGALSMHHPVGTARMGRDEDAVVDAQLRVRGVAGLRVADASIMPTITTGRIFDAGGSRLLGRIGNPRIAARFATSSFGRALRSDRRKHLSHRIRRGVSCRIALPMLTGATGPTALSRLSVRAAFTA